MGGRSWLMKALDIFALLPKTPQMLSADQPELRVVSLRHAIGVTRA